MQRHTRISPLYLIAMGALTLSPNFSRTALFKDFRPQAGKFILRRDPSIPQSRYMYRPQRKFCGQH